MSIFGKIMGAIFGTKADAATPGTTAPAGSAAGAAPASPGAAAAPTVDVAPILDKAVAAKVALSFPEQAGTGTHVNVSGGGVAAHAPHRDEAIQFLEFLTSEEAQAIFAGANHEYPVVGGVTPPKDVAAYSNFKADPMPVVTYGRRQAEAQAVFDQAGWR